MARAVNKTALVLGGGFAGLSAAIYLKLAGFHVTLLEQDAVLGGKASSFSKDGFYFDTGPSVFTLKSVIEDLFRAAGRELPFRLEPMDLLCRYFFPSGRSWDVYQDLEKTAAQLSATEASIYRRLLAEAKKLFESSSPTFVFGKAPTPLDLLRYGLQHGLKAHPLKTLPQLLESFGAAGDLKQFFLRFATYFGADPYRAPAVLHNIAWTELGLGVYYPEGGIYTVVKSLATLAQELGVCIKTGEKVERLEPSDNRIKTVYGSSGSFKADVIISTIDIIRTYSLLNKQSALEKLEPSLSGFVLLLGVQGKSAQIQHHTISFSSNYPAEFEAIRAGHFPDEPTLYLNVSSKTQADHAPAGCENWFVMANAPALRDGIALDEDAFTSTILNTLERRRLVEKKQILFAKTLGPNYLARLAHRGSIYGTAPHSLLQTLRPSQHIKGINNLVLAGGSVYPGGGIPLALLSGKLAAETGSRLVSL